VEIGEENNFLARILGHERDEITWQMGKGTYFWRE